MKYKEEIYNDNSKNPSKHSLQNRKESSKEENKN